MGNKGCYVIKNGPLTFRSLEYGERFRSGSACVDLSKLETFVDDIFELPTIKRKMSSVR